MSAYEEATELVIEALVSLPGFEWDDDDLADCAHAAVNALEAAGRLVGVEAAEPGDRNET